MKPALFLQSLALMATALLTIKAYAYEDEKKKELCRPPKIQEFTLPVYSENNKQEVAPESEFSFVVSGWANHKKIQLTGKGKDIPFTVKSNETFHKITAKLIPEYTGQTVRISTRIPALLDCYSTMGWLVKVADKPQAPVAPAGTAAPAEANPAGASTTGSQPAADAPTTQTPPATKPAEAASQPEAPAASPAN
ncbi:MAG: hypothetical protein FJ190_12430 [Gammaproteobacteria bacterium]|nr:hypothetical protein [Gammaproteobacteria bacterium]